MQDIDSGESTIRGAAVLRMEKEVFDAIEGDTFGRWPAKIIHRGDDADTPQVTLYRLQFRLDDAQTLRLHVSADEWFDMFCDGAFLLRGPQISCPSRWHYDTVDIPLEAGAHVLLSRVFALGKELRPQPVMSLSPGWLCCPDPESPLLETLATGLGNWEWQDAGEGWTFHKGGITNQYATAFGPVTQHQTPLHNWPPEGVADRWSTEFAIREAPVGVRSSSDGRLFPGQARPASRNPLRSGKIRHVSHGDCLELYTGEGSSEQQQQAERFLEGGELTIAAGDRRRVLIDFDDYVMAFVRLTAKGSSGARISLTWTERLMATLENKECWATHWSRSRIDNLYVIGPRDQWELEGAGSTRISLPWKRCGRYLELVAQAGDAPLTLQSFLVEDNLPASPLLAEFSCDHQLLQDLQPICRRTLEVGLESSFCDCPYYEQVQWVGDLYPILLCHLAAGGDEAVYRQALQLVAESVIGSRPTQARFPHAATNCVIPSFCLWFASAVHDYALWRGHAGFVRQMMPTIRRNVETFLALRNFRGLCAGVPGWNYFDWAPGWLRGMPPINEHGESGTFNLLVAVVCHQLSALEEWMQEPELAARWSRCSAEIFETCQNHLWQEERGLFADAPGATSFSEHSQALALLHPDLPEEKRKRLLDALAQNSAAQADPQSQAELAPVQPFFSHHLFQALAQNQRIDLLFDRLKLWQCLVDWDFKTTPETMPGTRSDSHGWSSHPLYHSFASVAGIRPDSFGFGSVVIRPQLGPLTKCQARMWTPHGFIELRISRDNGQLHITGCLPEGLPGRLELPAKSSQSISGQFDLRC